jgi:hypothetical protein
MPPRCEEALVDSGSAGIARARLRALRFVEGAGDELARRRAQALAGFAPATRVVDWLERADAAAGSEAAARAGDPEAGRTALAVLADLGALRGAFVERVVARLAAGQCHDGSFLPLGPGSEAAAIECTGRLLGLLARTACVRDAVLDAGADWLAARFSPERVQGFAWGPLAAYAAAFSSVAHEGADAILQWCGRELERGFRAGAFDGVATARVLLDCDAPSLPGARLAAQEVVVSILGAQEGDGGFAPGAGGPDRVARSLDALAAFLRLTRAGPPLSLP